MTLRQYLSLCDVYARMMLKANASRYRLGVLWWFLEPLLWVGVFYVVFNLILDSGKRSGDFILFLACGKFAFIWFSKAVVSASSSIVNGSGLVGKINVPKSLFVIAAVQETVYRQVTVYLLLLVILVLAGIWPGATWLLMIPVALVMYLLILACGMVAACLVCWIRDFQQVIPLLMTFLLFTSGIFWDINEIADRDKAELLMMVNPMAFMIDAHRQVLMYGAVPDMLNLAAIGLVSVLTILGALWYMHRFSQYIALKVLT